MPTQFYVIMFVLFISITTSSIAQTSSTAKKTTTSTGTTPTTTTAPPPTNKVDKKLNEANQNMSKASNTMDNAAATTDKAKKTVENITKLFKPKTANEALIIIPDIDFDDENLQKLLEAVKEHKDVKKASIEYTDGVATINTTLKNKANTDFWTELPKEIKSHFKMKTKSETSLLVAYEKTHIPPTP